jgi:DNA-binding PadR family transcriptional regulator
MEQLVKSAATRLTPLGVMVLALLREGDMHPYEMIRLMRQRRHDRLVPITNGTFYHTVARLERQGLLAEVGVDRDGNRPERTTYTMTDAGQEAVAEWVRAELPRTDRPAEFRVAIAESHNIDRQEVIDLLTIRRAALAAEHRLFADGVRSARERLVPEQYLIQTGRQAALLAADLEWLDGFLAALEEHRYPWGIDIESREVADLADLADFA